jgi:hypothetical protein
MKSRFRRRTRRTTRLSPLTAVVGTMALVILGVLAPLGGSAPANATGPTTVGGLPAGAIKHVWLIILENKSFDETFTGLNANSYLWQTLPSEGVLLTNYYGTGHTSQDNYIALAAGQGPEPDTQNDCSYADTPFGSNSSIVTTGSVGGDNNWTYGQVQSSLGPNSPTPSTYNNSTSPPTISATNGCIYPNQTPTLFDQFNAAGVSWKGYAQDLGGAQQIGSTSWASDSVPGREDGLCGAPGSSSNNPVTNPTLMSDTSTFPSDVSNLTSASLVAGSGSNNNGTYSTNNPEYSDQYVAKHFPFSWFASLTGGGASNPIGTPLTEPQASASPAADTSPTNCDSYHIANLDDPNEGLIHDLDTPGDVPQFSWITPNNCSDAHDTTCKGNNLSGAFGTYSSGPHAGQVNLNDPIYNPGSGLPADDPEATKPVNYTGGLYASDLFLAYYVPLIEASSAYADGGLIDITFDEGEPSFTYSGNSFNNVPTSQAGNQGTSSPLSGPPADAPTFGTSGSTAPGADSIFGAYSISADTAGENISGTNVNTEPTGPNAPLATDGSNRQLYPGPGFNLDIDRPPTCTSTSPLTPADCEPNIVRGDAGTSPAPRTDTVTGGGGSNTISYPTPTSGNPSLVGDDTGREITSVTIGTSGGTSVCAIGSSGYTATSGPSSPCSSLPTGGIFVGVVSDTGELYPANSGGPTVAASFQAVDDSGNPVNISGSVTKVTLSAEGDPTQLSTLSTATAPVTADPLFDATDPTSGGGDTGSVLISPYIKPGTTTSTFYNHYSWLRTMEDLFDVSGCVGTSTDVTLTGLSSASVCGGLDGQGHIGYAAQTGLTPFGSDVFNAPTGNGFNPPPFPVNPGEGLPEVSLVVLLPAFGLLLMGGFMVVRHRRTRAIVP